MNAKKKINIIIGAGGHTKVIMSSLLRSKKKNFYLIDDKIKKKSYLSKYKNINEKKFLLRKNKNLDLYLGIGITIKDNKRTKVIKRYLKSGFTFKKLKIAQNLQKPSFFDEK